MNRQQGFTLVEVAIVVVIIGLILGSVMKAQEVIANAKVKNLEMTFNSLTQAIYTYQERYSALPGDDSNAGRFQNLDSSANGDGDGVIEGSYKDYTNESGKVWLHLRAAQLITGSSLSSDDNQGPMNAYQGGIGIGMDSTLMPWVFIGFTNIPSEVCIIFEGRSDGNSLNPLTGRVRATNVDGTSLTITKDGTTSTKYPTNKRLNLLFAL